MAINLKTFYDHVVQLGSNEKLQTPPSMGEWKRINNGPGTLKSWIQPRCYGQKTKFWYVRSFMQISRFVFQSTSDTSIHTTIWPQLTNPNVYFKRNLWNLRRVLANFIRIFRKRLFFYAAEGGFSVAEMLFASEAHNSCKNIDQRRQLNILQAERVERGKPEKSLHDTTTLPRIRACRKTIPYRKMSHIFSLSSSFSGG